MWLKLDWGVAELAAVKKVPTGDSLRYRGFERKKRLNGGGVTQRKILFPWSKTETKKVFKSESP